MGRAPVALPWLNYGRKHTDSRGETTRRGEMLRVRVTTISDVAHAQFGGELRGADAIMFDTGSIQQISLCGSPVKEHRVCRVYLWSLIHRGMMRRVGITDKDNDGVFQIRDPSVLAEVFEDYTIVDGY